ncbi:MAG: dihydrofolate reductase family protein [Chloroflexota bacterium]
MTASPALEDATTADSGRAALVPLLELPEFCASQVRGAGMPPVLEKRYGGPLLVPLRTDRPTVVANFVTTLDGIVAFGSGDLSGGGVVSGFHEPDRFVMGLLRALADVVVIGAGTLAGTTAHRWIAQHAHPASASAFEEWRATMGLAPRPTTVVVTATGNVPVRHPGLNDPSIPAVIATTPTGAQRLADADLPANVTVEPIGPGPRLAGSDVLALAERLGARLVLSEGGPHLVGELVGSDLLDELFLTLAPQLAGRAGERLGLVEGVALPPHDTRWQDLVSIRGSSNHLFLRYRRRSAV